MRSGASLALTAFDPEACMRQIRRPLAVCTWVWLTVVFAAAVLPAKAAAQTEVRPAWAIVPLVGLGAARDNDTWGSGGAEVALDVEYGGAAWRGSASGSIRGLGMSCSEGCIDDGAAVALGASRSLGVLWIGGGVGFMRYREWHLRPYGRISLDAAPVRFDVRVELPRQRGRSVYVPVLIGIPISR
jgi:hypothetical protein